MTHVAITLVCNNLPKLSSKPNAELSCKVKVNNARYSCPENTTINGSDFC